MEISKFTTDLVRTTNCCTNLVWVTFTAPCPTDKNHSVPNLSGHYHVTDEVGKFSETTPVVRKKIIARKFSEASPTNGGLYGMFSWRI